MAWLQKRKRPHVNDHPPDQTPSKKARLSRPDPPRTQNSKARPDEHPHDQASSKKRNPGRGYHTRSIPQNRKRRADEPPRDQSPSKKPKSNSTVRRTSNFPPEFYNNLAKVSKIWLTPRALQELNRRNENLPPFKPKVELSGSRGAKVAALVKFGVSRVALFAAAGGPDLGDLQGVWLCNSIVNYPRAHQYVKCLGPTSNTHAMASSSISSLSSRRTQSTKPTSVSTKRSSAYDANFRQHCINHRIYPPFYKFPDGRRPPKPANIDEIRQALKVPRGSLSPTVASETAFEDFQYRNTTKSEGTVMRNIIPLIAGDVDIPNEGHLPFTNLASITENITVNPTPDFFDGAHPEAVDQEVRDALEEIIIPTKKAGVPVAPNLFLEAKSSGGTLDVAEGQVVLDGAHGTYIMHTLQNHLLDKPVYDGNAYAFTAIFLGGYLNLYAHHVTAPVEPGQRPGYHITQLKAYALIGDHDVWLEGIGAFRNMRKLAKRYRDRFIETANARARKHNTQTARTEDDAVVSAIEEHQDPCSSPLDFYDCQLFAEPDDEEKTREIHETNAGLAIFDHTYDKDGADDTEAAAGFATSFTSSFVSISREEQMSHKSQSKIPRSPPSPSSARQSKRAG